ncbi:MarP family serine protease [Nocardioides zeae]|uniref:MarP family serine protease n=1 Tax=Nocardioides zeae TaxID=1457234 RepID=UPI002859F223|nr:MarP family serine protease [Nocardioides zeae]MDR6173818.1 hypothetical protein [Nocardioides zeae]
MNWLDWLLLVLVATYALSGYWQGFITGAFATIGLLAGGVAGIVVAPLLLGNADPGLAVSLGALFIVIVCASIGQASFQFFGAMARDRITWQPARAVDAVGGAALSVVAVLLVAWALGVAVAGTRIGGVTEAVRGSAVLSRVDSVLPGQADRLLGAFNSVVGSSFFPQYLEPFAPERIVEVDPGDPTTLNEVGVVQAQSRVLKIRGDNSCGRGVEGTGFLYGDDRLMTNAHVVAGVDEPRVELNGDWVDATVVLYDPQTDVAVLALDDDGLQPLAFAEGAEGESVAILGYPQDGPFDQQPAADPRRAAAALARHLRQRRGRARRLLAARPRAPRQLGRSDRERRRRGRRGHLRGVGDRRRHGLRAHHGPGGRRRRRGHRQRRRGQHRRLRQLIPRRGGSYGAACAPRWVVRRGVRVEVGRTARRARRGGTKCASPCRSRRAFHPSRRRCRDSSSHLDAGAATVRPISTPPPPDNVMRPGGRDLRGA